MRFFCVVAGACLLAGIPAAAESGTKPAATAPLRIEVKIADSVQKNEKLTGHLIVVISKDPRCMEPGFQLHGTYDSQQGFGVDVGTSWRRAA